MTQVDALEAALAAAHAEAAAEGDLLMLPMHEDQLGGCSLKYVTWLALARTMHPRATFIALADDDVYIQFSHFVSELRRVVRNERRQREELILWGFLFWRPFYNNVTLSVAQGVEYETHDASVSKHRYRVERCSWELRHRANTNTRYHFGEGSCLRNSTTYCDLLHPRERLMVEKNEVSSLAPMPILNGPLFALSNPLARALVEGGRNWLARFKRTHLVRWARSRKRIPFRLRDLGCWPFGDATLGLWAGELGYAGRNVTLVDTPKFVVHHPMPTRKKGAFGRASIVLHGLKDNSTNTFWKFAKERGAGIYVPPEGRTCKDCASQGWVTWPGSPLQRWRCCGWTVTRRPRRQWPRSVLEGMALTDPGLREARRALRLRLNGSARIGEALAETMLRSRLARACNPTEDGKARHGGLSAKAKEITT